MRRLMRYHVFQGARSPTPEQWAQDGELYEQVASGLLDTKAQLEDKYSYLLYHDAMRAQPTCEAVMLEKLWLGAEREELAEFKVATT